jgi:hypothetical protein
MGHTKIANDGWVSNGSHPEYKTQSRRCHECLRAKSAIVVNSVSAIVHLSTYETDSSKYLWQKADYNNASQSPCIAR